MSIGSNNITGPQAIYLDQGLWAISIEKATQMEIRCPKVTQVKSLKPPTTFVNLQPACSAFSPGVTELKILTNFLKPQFTNSVKKIMLHGIKCLTRSYSHTNVVLILQLVKHHILCSISETHPYQFTN